MGRSQGSLSPCPLQPQVILQLLIPSSLSSILCPWLQPMSPCPFVLSSSPCPFVPSSSPCSSAAPAPSHVPLSPTPAHVPKQPQLPPVLPQPCAPQLSWVHPPMSHQAILHGEVEVGECLLLQPCQEGLILGVFGLLVGDDGDSLGWGRVAGSRAELDPTGDRDPAQSPQGRSPRLQAGAACLSAVPINSLCSRQRQSWNPGPLISFPSSLVAASSRE